MPKKFYIETFGCQMNFHDSEKVAGTLVLKEVCEGLDLDFFVIFSSLVSILGGRGQVDYCAASNFQDVFAHAEQGTLARSVIAKTT